MTLRHKALSLIFLAAALFTAGLAHGQDNELKFKLKPGAAGKNCITCHAAFKEQLAKPFVHTPLKQGECTGCHNPHASAHGKLLAGQGGGLCFTCHDAVVPAGSRSTHKPVLESACLKCHDPHGSASKGNLVKPGNELCAECHKGMVEGIAKVKFRHKPVAEGCVNCHLPHASGSATFLLKQEVTALCTGCHKTDRPMFVKKHMAYPVANSRCTSCHDPHGSDQPSILYNNVHKPIASKMCNQCHEDSASADPLKLKKEGAELCKSCHSTMMTQMQGQSRVHWPVLSKEGCLSCHNPHAATQKKLLKAPMLVLCGNCHNDTINRQLKSMTKHEPISVGLCTSCHEPHASNNQVLAKGTSTIDLCGRCHDWQKHSTHPIGDKVKDRRNKNLSVQCLSCHRSHGTEYKGMLPFKSTSDLCIQCHFEYKR